MEWEERKGCGGVWRLEGWDGGLGMCERISVGVVIGSRRVEN